MEILSNPKIAVVVPTIREECFEEFKNAWDTLFNKHDVELISIHDGDKPFIEVKPYNESKCRYSAPKGYWYLGELPKEITELTFNKNDGIRNQGFAYIAKNMPHIKYIITLDDDTKPIGDPIQDHIDALNTRKPISWMNTAGDDYMRGFPYCVRDEAEVVLSHGVWEGVKDWDAPTQLVQGNKDVSFYKGAIPKGVYFAVCGMNLAFKRKMLPYMYFAPMGYKVGIDRFADIWMGINAKKAIDKNGWAVVSGYAKVQHDRASNVWKNLQKEAKGLELNETFWNGDESDPYFKLYKEKRLAWQKLITKLIN